MLSVIMENSINRLYNFQLLLFIADSFSYLLDTQTSVERGSAILLPILVSPIDSISRQPPHRCDTFQSFLSRLSWSWSCLFMPKICQELPIERIEDRCNGRGRSLVSIVRFGPMGAAMGWAVCS